MLLLTDYRGLRLARVYTGAGGDVPVSVKCFTAIRTIKGNFSVLVVFFSAAKARIFQLEHIIVVRESLFAFPYAFCHFNFFLATIVVNSHIHGRRCTLSITCIATFL